MSRSYIRIFVDTRKELVTARVLFPAGPSTSVVAALSCSTFLGFHLIRQLLNLDTQTQCMFPRLRAAFMNLLLLRAWCYFGNISYLIFRGTQWGLKPVTEFIKLITILFAIIFRSLFIFVYALLDYIIILIFIHRWLYPAIISHTASNGTLPLIYSSGGYSVCNLMLFCIALWICVFK